MNQPSKPAVPAQAHHEAPHLMANSQNGNRRVYNGINYLAKYREYVVAIDHSGVADTTAAGYIQVDADTPFLHCTTHMSDTNDPTTSAPGLYGQYENFISVVDQASGNMSWQNDVIPRSAFAGGREHGRQLTDENFINKNTKLAFTLKEPHSGAEAGTSYIVLSGWALYRV